MNLQILKDYTVAHGGGKREGERGREREREKKKRESERKKERELTLFLLDLSTAPLLGRDFGTTDVRQEYGKKLRSFLEETR